MKRKNEILKKSGTLNPHPENVKDEKFIYHDFFDANDLVQVRYEMVRYSKTDEKNISEIANLFGTSRLTVYRLIELFDEQGLAGLVPQKRGPREASKISAAVVAYACKLMDEDKGLTKEQILKEIENKFGIQAHRRTLERALKKNSTANIEKRK